MSTSPCAAHPGFSAFGDAPKAMLPPVSRAQVWDDVAIARLQQGYLSQAESVQWSLLLQICRFKHTHQPDTTTKE